MPSIQLSISPLQEGGAQQKKVTVKDDGSILFFTGSNVPFSPSQVSGLVFWMDPSTNVTLSGSSTITQIVSRDTAGLVAYQTTGSNRPTIVTGDLGLPVIDFSSAASQHLTVNGTGSLQSSNYSIFFVHKYKTGTTFGTTFTNTSNASWFDGFGFLNGNGTPVSEIRLWAQTYTTNFVNYSATTGSWNIYSGMYDSANVSLWRNGTLVGQDPYSGSLTYAGNPRMSFGAFTYSPGINYPANIRLGEVLIYNRALTTTERQSVETYLNQRWSIF